MRIALVGAEHEENLALRYIQGALEAAGHEIELIRFNRDDELDAAAHAWAASTAPLAGISMVFSLRARSFAALVARARELGYRGHIVAGGHFAAFNAEELLKDVPALDSIAIGEGEEIMLRLADVLAAPTPDLSTVRGLVWCTKAGECVRNAAAEKPPDLERLPHPAHKQPPDRFLGLPICNLLASRGCAHQCYFCSIAAWHRLCGGPRVRLREPEQIANEIAGLYTQGYRIFNFHDDHFFLPRPAASLERFQRLDAALKARSVGRIAFAVKSRPDHVDETVYRFLKEMGLFRVFLGIEAGTEESLANLGRRQSLADNERALATVNRLKLHACFNLLILNPDSTLEDVRANVAFLRKHPDNPMNFCRTEVYEGTPLKEKLRAEGRLTGSYWGYDYVIRDGRAQHVFELFCAGLRGRHMGEDCLNHLVMAVDFEGQLLGHFFGAHRSLRRHVKAYVRRVNLNTCGYLNEVCGIADRGFAWNEDGRRLVQDLAGRVRADNEELAAEGREWLDAIRRAAREAVCAPRGRLARSAATVGVVATLTLAGSACSSSGKTDKPFWDNSGGGMGGGGTQVCEMAAPPPPTGNPATIQTQVVAELLPHVARLTANPSALSLDLWLEDNGSIQRLSVTVANQTQWIGYENLRDIRFNQPGACGKRYQMSFTAEEVLAARKASMRSGVVQAGTPAPGQEAESAFTASPLTRTEVRAKLLPLVARKLEKAEGVTIDVAFDDKALLAYVSARQGEREIDLSGLDLTKVRVPAGEWNCFRRLSFTADEVAKAKGAGK
jgi:radical SAM superfamily enzyme YgiQ (UPF0313 family)